MANQLYYPPAIGRQKAVGAFGKIEKGSYTVANSLKITP